MKTTRRLALALVLSSAWLAAAPPASAQDSPQHEPRPGAPAKPETPLDKAAASTEAKKPTRTLTFDAPPSSWKARPPEPRGYLGDWDLPAAEGDAEPARANVLYYPVDPATYRERLSHRWKQANGQPPSRESVHESVLDGPAWKLHVVDFSGTYAPKDAEPRAGYRIVAVLLDVPGGAWSAWLYGPAKSVEKHRQGYLDWLRTAKAHELSSAAASPAKPAEAAKPAQTVKPAEAAKPADRDPVADVRFVHGAPAHGTPGPWSLAGYRIGRDVLARLGISREQSWEIVVTHRSPARVQLTCMLDGLLAATGASPGKMNLVHEATADDAEVETIVLHKPTRRRLVYRLTPALVEKIRPVEPADFPAAAKMLEGLKDEEVFTVEEGVARREAD